MKRKFEDAQLDSTNNKGVGGHHGVIRDLRFEWYYSWREKDENTPSRRDGISLAEENNLRITYCFFIWEIGWKLKADEIVIGRANVLCHRFFNRRSHANHDKHGIALACLIIASKSLKNLLLLDKVTEECLKQTLMIDPEVEISLYLQSFINQVTEAIGSNFNVVLPFKYFSMIIHEWKTPEPLSDLAFLILSGTFFTTLHLEFSALNLAGAAVYLAYFSENVCFKQCFWECISLNRDEMERIVDQLLGFLERIL